MVFVCNLRSIHNRANVVILFAIKTCQPCHYIKPIARVYTRECHENKNTRFWATYDLTGVIILGIKALKNNSSLISFFDKFPFSPIQYKHGGKHWWLKQLACCAFHH